MSADANDKKTRRQRRREDDLEEKAGSIFLEKKFWYSLIALVLMCGVGFMQFIFLLSDAFSSTSGGTTFLDVSDAEKLKQIFFSGQPSVIFCLSDHTVNNPIPQIVADISGEMASHGDTASVPMYAANCFKKMAGSEKTIAERFNFGKNEGFLAVFANQNKPAQLSYLSNAKSVGRQIRSLVSTKIQRVTYLKDFKKCQNRKTCVILGAKTSDARKSAEATFKPLLKTHRGVAVFSIDTGFWKVSLDTELAKDKPKGDERSAICVIKGSSENDSEKNGKKDGKTYLASWLQNWSEDEAADFMKLCEAGGDASWTMLKKGVDIKARTKKAKVVKAPKPDANKKDAAKKAKDGTRKADKEKVGRRAEKADDWSGDEDTAVEEDSVEEVEL